MSGDIVTDYSDWRYVGKPWSNLITAKLRVVRNVITEGGIEMIAKSIRWGLLC